MKKVFYQKQSAFTLIELLVTIFVIGIIISLLTIYFSQVKKNNRDYKRLSDISEIQLALENYKFFEGRYPESISSSTSLIGSTTGITFLEKIPVSPEYGNDDCLITSYNYSYDEDNKIYGLNFCLEGKIENYTSGIKCSYPGGIKDGSCQALAFSGSLANGEVGVAYGPYTFTTSGGLAPYSFSISSGTLPTGLSLDSSGVLSGTPTLSGEYTFNVQVTDSLLSTSSNQLNMTIIWSCGSDLVDSRDSKSYTTVLINDQCWMKENLAYLPMVHNNANYAASSTAGLPGYGVYGYNGSDVATAKATANYSIYGVLYNWLAVNQVSICPTGWHVPSDTEWTTLSTYLGGVSVAGGKMKETGITHWNSPNTGATNSSSFTGLPAGYRNTDGSFASIKNNGFFWTSSVYNSSVFNHHAWRYYLSYYYSTVTREYAIWEYGLSIRCLKTD